MPSRVRIKRPRVIAPRLASGKSREQIGHGLPPHIKDGLRLIAARENQSVSWVLEQVIIRYFGLETPEYVPRKVADSHETKSRAGVIPHPARVAGRDR